MLRFFCLTALLIVAPSLQATLSADVWLDYAWGEGMVLQSGVSAPLAGTAKPAETVSLTFRSRDYQTVADQNGKWRIDVDPGPAGGPFAMRLKGNNTIDLAEVHIQDLVLASVLGNGMVLQRGGKAPLFGTAIPGHKVEVEFRDRKYDTTAAADGAWRVDLDPGTAGGPFPLAIRGPTTLQFSEVYVGEVWICSGQSNMRWSVSYTNEAGKVAQGPANPHLRLQLFPELGYAANHPPARFAGWQAADKKSVHAFSGTGYFFGAALQEKLQVPVGLIQAAVDATSIREWLPGDKLAELKLGPAAVQNHYTRRVRAIQPFAIRGVIWYQGEADATKDVFNVGYDRRLAALIEGWRRDWGQGDFPFLFVQLPRLGFGAEQVHRGALPSAEEREFTGDWARVIDQQRRVLDMVPSVGMAVYYDQTTGMLHPPQKRAAGERLALVARGLVYGEPIEYSGPLVKSAERRAEHVVVRFTHAAGLTAHDGPLRQCELAGEDGEFRPVAATIEGETVKLDASGLKGPLSVRYAYRQWPDGNLTNATGLPASPFLLTDIK